MNKLAELDISLEARGSELDIYDPRQMLTDDLLLDIKTNKPGLLTLLKDTDIADKGRTIPPVGSKDAHPLSFGQQRLYFLYEFDPDSIAYNMPRVLSLEGDPDLERVRDTFQRLTDRHGSLRTYFVQTEEGPMQKIAAGMTFTLERLQSGKESAEIIKDFIRPFDLATPPLLRVGLVNTGPDRHLLILDMHHIIADGISQGILINDFISLYEGKALPGPELQFKDFAEWQRSEAFRTLVEGQRGFWLKEFAGGVAPLDLPTDFARPLVRQYAGRSRRSIIDREETERLMRLAASEDATLFMILLSIYTIFLSRISNSTDIVVGTPVAGRLHPQLEGMVGLLMNILPLRNRPEGKLCFREYLAAVRARTLACIENQDHQYEELIGELGVGRDASRNPLFDVLFDFANYEQPVIRIPGLTIESLDMASGAAKLDLSLSAVLDERGILLNFEYSTHLFREETIERFFGYFHRIVAAVIQNPEIRIEDIDILPDSERRRILQEFNDTRMDFPEQETVVSLFEGQVRESLFKPAVVYEGRRLTYGELNARANGLAHLLRSEYAIRPGDIVGIMAERSGIMLTGLLGILKSGAAYLPIDPAYPSDRAAYMLTDSGTSLLLTDGGRESIAGYAGTILNLEKLVARGLNREEEADPDPINKPQDLCYLIYTSGSTGRPKGVMVSHRNVVNFMAGLSRRLPAGQDECLLAVTSISFDISVLELFWTLCRGIEVVIHPADISLNELDRYLPTDSPQVDFSLFFFSNYDHCKVDKYGLLLDAVRFADSRGFKAVWTPERHFHEFGGLYPNPSLISAALAMITDKIALRCGSVISPLHDAVRIAEEWSVVDNLSGGRVGLSFAPGWNPNDFAIRATDFGSRQQTMYEQIAEVQRLWGGEGIPRMNGLNREVTVRTFPEPLQKELPCWVTSGGTEETFRKAGAIGANLLTHLLGQEPEELARKIGIYRQSRKLHGHAGRGIVTIMLHTYIGESIQEVEALVEGPFIEYLKSAIGLTRLLDEATDGRPEDLSEEKKDLILKNAFRRYYRTGSLIGTRTSCRETIRKLALMGVDEIACLIDFGVEKSRVLEGLGRLDELKELSMESAVEAYRPVSMLQSTPSFIKLVLESGRSAAFLRSLRFLLLGGEAVHASLLKRLQQDCNAEIYNMYGPTETTIWSCIHAFGREPGKVLVGKPMGNTRVYILDDRLRLVPLGVAGCLYIGGEGVSKGYWRRPELTAERFIPNPFEKDALVYRTGDMARWMPDGTIELLGREDHQVKIRGYRIEPGEVENRLASCEGIREAIIMAVDRDGDKFLAAYYVADKPVPAEFLRGKLMEELPEYMIPSVFIPLAAMPLTPNGKVDRKALPVAQPASGADYEAPVTDTEKRLMEIWAEVLKTDQSAISVSGDFFKLGGHSLNAMAVVNRIGKCFGRAIPLKDFYGIATVRGIAAYLDGFFPGGTPARAKQISTTLPIASAPPKAYYSLSSQQKRMYFLHRLDPSSLAYNETGVYEVQGELDTERLSLAFEKLIARHEILRTSFDWIKDNPVQRIAGGINFRVEAIIGAVDKESAIRDFIRPFDLGKAPLMRAGIIHVDRTTSLLIVDMHHVVTDGISKGIMIRDFMALYQGEDLPLPTLQYKDYAEWSLQEEQQRESARQRQYWLEQFAGEIPQLNLPTDFGRPNVKTYAGKMTSFVLGAEMTAGLRETSAEQKITMYMLLLAAYSIALGRLGNAEDLIVGTPSAGRYHTDLERMMGIFVNTLPVKLRPLEELSIREYLQDVKERTLECFDHQTYPYEELIDALKLERAPGRNPLFDVLFVYHNFERAELRIPGLTLQHYGRVVHVSKFDLTLEVLEADDRISLNIEYSTELFRDERVERFIACIRTVVEVMLKDPDRKISDISMLSRGEEELLLRKLNETICPYPARESVLDAFERQAGKTPEAVALRYEEYTVTYNDLRAGMERMAAYLANVREVRPGDMVGLMLERDEYLIPSIFGILKAGGVYVPIDPAYPAERIQAILSDSGLKVLVTRSAFSHRLPEGSPAVVDLDLEWGIILNCPLPAVWPAVGGRDLAYVIYTSGSTGKPKGVMIEHHSVVNRLCWMQKEYPLNAKDVLLQKTPVIFDVSIWELLWWPSGGASLCILPPGGEKDPQVITGVIRKHGVTVIHFVPSMLDTFLSSLARAGGLESVKSLRLTFASGEALKAVQVGLFGRLLNRAWQTRLINLYGPTEATVEVSFHECDFGRTDGPVPIGKPIDNIALYILDARGNLAFPGVQGELGIAGAGLARGYLNDPGLTSKKFIDRSYAPGGRIYRTGDLAKWNAEGEVVFLGRIDGQVKIRGYRIEPEEIEGRLMNYGPVTAAAVVAMEKENDKYLTAYYTADHDIDGREWRDYLAPRLPEYMIPAFFVRLSALPLTINGKLDRKALPAPEYGGRGEPVAATGSTEEKLLEIWAEVLKVPAERVGVTDSFFEFGGHSLKALHLADRIRAEFAAELGLRKLFEHVTIRSQARLIDGSDRSVVSGLPVAGEKDYYVVSPAQERLYMEQQRNPDRLTGNISIGYEIRGDFDPERARRALQVLMDRHESLRTRFHIAVDEIVQVVMTHAEVSLTILNPEKYAAVQEAFRDFVRPFDLAESPLVRWAILQLPGRSSYLLADVHHIICDGISLNILMNDFRTAYQGLELPVPGRRYVDYALWQKQSAGGMERQREFWKQQLGGILPQIGLPVTRSRDQADIYQADRMLLTIGGDTYQKVRTFAAAAGVSEFMLLLSAFYILVAKLSGNHDILIGTDAGGRSEPGLRGIVGTFVNVLPLRISVPESLPYAEFLSRVRECVLAGFEHGDYPFDRMTDLSGPLPGRKLVEIYFAYRNFLERETPSGLPEFISLGTGGLPGITRYELELDVEQAEGHFDIYFLYSTDLYDEPTIRLMTAYYHAILDAVMADPSLLIENISLKSKLS